MKRPRNHPDWTLIFQHLPKTGGITLSHVVVQNIPGKDIFHIRSPKFTKAPTFSENCGILEDFARRPASERSRYRCVLGHLQFGLHTLIPRPSKYVAIFRDPVERILSHHGQYNAMVRNQEMGENAKALSLEEFIHLKPVNARNLQCRFLIGRDFETIPADKLLDRAIENLDSHYAVVGTVEGFNETVLVLSRMMGWKRMGFIRHNVGTQRLRASENPPELIEKIREDNALDAELHAYAKRCLEDSISSYGPDFERDLAALERANRKKRRQALFIARLRAVKRVVLGQN